MSEQIRGRMFVSGRLGRGENVYTFEVIDTSRDVVLHRDNCCGFEDSIWNLNENVTICRKAWRMGVLKKRTWCS